MLENVLRSYDYFYFPKTKLILKIRLLLLERCLPFYLNRFKVIVYVIRIKFINLLNVWHK